MRQGIKRIVTLGCPFVLVGCISHVSTLQKTDGPPTAAMIAHAKIKPVSPRAEPKSRYGNPPSYKVLGNTYRVLPSAKDFKQSGLASWYGTKFHRKRTSSGEPYDMFSMTAAHRSLPLPTYLKVRNTENNREIVVKVNDRGPFHNERILDLSYAAAKALGILKKGVGHVVIEAIKLGVEPAPAKLYLQVGAFKDAHKASDYQTFLASIIPSNVSVLTKESLHIVAVGPFGTYEKQHQMKQQLAAHGINNVFGFMQ